jgi:peptide deformylase
MARLDIRIYGDPILRQRAEAVTRFDEALRQLAEDMLETMYAADGVGLAAPQVGRRLRLLVVDTQGRGEDERGPLVLVNPRILESWGSWSYDEGCLSIPGITAEIVRPESVRVAYQDLEGAEHEEVFSRLLGRVVQHEADHLDGKLFVDYLSPMRRAMVLKKLRQLSREGKRSPSAL